MSLKYNEYLHEHCSGVRQGLQWMADNLIGLDQDSLDKARFNAEVHDNSKMQPEEYKAYDDYFYGGNQTSKVKEAFDYAWLHHIRNNPHHWQYWVLINDDADEGTRALEMPLEYVYEMIADWWSFSWKKGNLMEIFDWYDDHKKRIIFHKNTKKIVETILDNIKAILKMQQRKENPSAIEDEDETVEQGKLGDDHDILVHSDLKEDKEKKFGVPEEHKFPLPDADHVRSAIRFFNYVDPKYEKELAEAILKRMDEYGLSFEDFGVGDENRFKKYIPEKYLAQERDADQ